MNYPVFHSVKSHKNKAISNKNKIVFFLGYYYKVLWLSKIIIRLLYDL